MGSGRRRRDRRRGWAKGTGAAGGGPRGAAPGGGPSFETVHPGSASAHAAATSASHTDRRSFTITTRRLRPFLAQESIVQSLPFGVANGSWNAPTAGSPLARPACLVLRITRDDDRHIGDRL